MPTRDVQRQQLIDAVMARGTGEPADVAVQIWQPLAAQLIAIIGEGGFVSLYARSFYLTQVAFPWLVPSDALVALNVRFANLKTSLEGQNPIEGRKASHMLILTFTNILASLIGEPLTISILSSAWGDNASDRHIAGKEFPHE